MGRLDLPDKHRDEDDYVPVFGSYLQELRADAERKVELERFLEAHRLTEEFERWLTRTTAAI